MTAQNHTGDKLGPYRLLERLGEGGMGVVYLAADAEHRKVAVKALRPAVASDPNARRRLLSMAAAGNVSEAIGGVVTQHGRKRLVLEIGYARAVDDDHRAEARTAR